MAFSVKRGVNISHWLSQSQVRGEARRQWFTEADVKRIADWGFDHIRLPIDEEQMWAESGEREAEAFDLLNAAIDWCEAAGLRIIIDLHILRSHYFNAEEEPALYHDDKEVEKFANLWRDLSAAMKARSVDLVAYELLNEAVAKDSQDWNRVVHQVFNVVRGLEPERTIILGSNRWCQVQTFPELDVPDDDKLILTFHYYNPMFITHYKAGWVDYGEYTGAIQYPGQSIPDEGLAELERILPQHVEEGKLHYDREAIKQHVMIAYNVAQQHNKPLYCGEFGVIEKTPLDIRRRWYQDVVSVLEELGIGWANWDYKGDFGLLTRDGQQDTGIREAMLPTD